MQLHSAPDAQLDTGWTRLASEDGRVTIAIPPTFHSALEVPKAPQLDLEQKPAAPPPDGSQPAPSADPQADQSMNRFMGDLNQASAQMEADQKKEIADEMASKKLIIWAWENGVPTIGEGHTAISVACLPGAGNTSLVGAMEISRAGMYGDAKSEKVTLPIGDAMVVKSDFKNVSGDEITDIRYVLLDSGDKYVVRFVATNAPDQIEPIADPVMQTLRIKPNG